MFYISVETLIEDGHAQKQELNFHLLQCSEFPSPVIVILQQQKDF